LELTYAAISAHATVWAAGTVVTGVVYHRLARRLGRRRLLWSTGAATAVGATMLIFAESLAMTLAAAAVMGTAGTLMQACALAALADAHPRRRSRALVESTIGASLAAVTVPFVLAAAESAGPGWRVGWVVPILGLAALYGLWGRVVLPAGRPGQTRGSDRRLPPAYWLLAVVVALGVAIEFCVVYFGPQLLRASGVGVSQAAASLALFYGAELVGRVIGAKLAHPGREVRLLLGSLALAVGGVVVLWLAPVSELRLVGLAVSGLGVANFYPLALSLAVGAAGGLVDRANGRSQLLIGVAVMIAPLALGVAADRVGLVPAFVIAPVLCALMAVLLGIGVVVMRKSAVAGTEA
jgi:predicted MFS family arabinose efflux permease